MKNRILILTSEFPPQPGGIGQHALDLAKHLSYSHEVRVIADQRSNDGEEEVDFDARQDFEVVRIKRDKLILWTYIKRVLKTIKLFRNYDLIITTGKFSLWQIHFIKGISSLKPILAIIHGSEVLLPSQFTRKLTDSALKKASVVVAVSNYTLELVQYLDLANATVIPNGITSIHEFNKKDITQSPINLITVGNLTQRKGQHNVIKALPEILKQFPQTHYHCVGLPTNLENDTALAEELSVIDHVTFHGRLDEAQKNNCYSESHIFLMLSERTSTGDVEGFGIAILEANAHSLPSIGSKGCGIEDAIEHGESGILVDPHNPVEVAIAVKQILNSYEDYQIDAHNHVQRFTWKTIIKSYNQIIDHLCA